MTEEENEKELREKILTILAPYRTMSEEDVAQLVVLVNDAYQKGRREVELMQELPAIIQEANLRIIKTPDGWIVRYIDEDQEMPMFTNKEGFWLGMSTGAPTLLQALEQMKEIVRLKEPDEQGHLDQNDHD